MLRIINHRSNTAVHRIFLIFLISSGLLLLSACSVPKHMQVRVTDDPQNIDEDVRFRTTYYFRVYDQCAALKPGVITNGDETDLIFEPKNSQNKVVLSDSLYRFRMTGKSRAINNHVKFESGTLKAWEIDPFGATIERDKATNRPAFISQQESHGFAKQEREYERSKRHIQDLWNFRTELSEKTSEKALSNNQAILDRLDEHILDAIANLGGDPTAPSSSQPVSAALDVAHIKVLTAHKHVNEVHKKLAEKANKLCAIPDATETENNCKESLIDEILRTEVQSNTESEIPEPTNNSSDSITKRLEKERQWYTQEFSKLQEKVNVLDEFYKQFELRKQRGSVLDAKKQTLDNAKQKFSSVQEAANHLGNQLTSFVTLKNKHSKQMEARDSSKEKFDQALAQTDAVSKEKLEHLKEEYKNHQAEFNRLDAQLEEVKSRFTKRIIDSQAVLGGLSNIRGENLANELQILNGIVRTQKDALALANKQQQYEDEVNKERLRGQLFSEVQGLIGQANNESQQLESLTLSVIKFTESYPLPVNAVPARNAKKEDDVCPKGMQRRRGFQVLGPEGFRTFNQDDRLIMAMTNSSQPLIEVMRDLAARSLNQQAPQSDQLLPLAEERIRILQSLRVTDTVEFNENTNLTEVLEKTINAFKGEDK